MPDWRETIEQIDWREKQHSQVACLSEDLNVLRSLRHSLWAQTKEGSNLQLSKYCTEQRHTKSISNGRLGTHRQRIERNEIRLLKSWTPSSKTKTKQTKKGTATATATGSAVWRVSTWILVCFLRPPPPMLKQKPLVSALSLTARWNFSVLHPLQSTLHTFKTALKTCLYKQYRKWFFFLISLPSPSIIPSVRPCACVCVRARAPFVWVDMRRIQCD